MMGEGEWSRVQSHADLQLMTNVYYYYGLLSYTLLCTHVIIIIHIF
jgi:hypothetical protein